MMTWTKKESKVLRSLNTPRKIQDFLDNTKYNISDFTHSPREVIRKRVAHCFDGAIFGAAALEFHGFPPLLVDLRANEFDDDHVLAVFRQGGLWGAIAKSNFTGCRYRDPVFRTLRELVMSYFHIYFNIKGRMTLREFSVPFHLGQVKDVDWRFTTESLNLLGERLDAVKHFDLIPKRAEKFLSPPDKRLMAGEMLGYDKAGAWGGRKNS